MTDCDDPKKMAGTIHAMYPNASIVLTLGCAGSVYVGKDGNVLTSGIYETNAVDTTAAGDTYTGFFLSEALTTGDVETALKYAAIASGISVSRHGASQSIPYAKEVKGGDDNGKGITPFCAWNL